MGNVSNPLEYQKMVSLLDSAAAIHHFSVIYGKSTKLIREFLLNIVSATSYYITLCFIMKNLGIVSTFSHPVKKELEKPLLSELSKPIIIYIMGKKDHYRI